MSIDIATSTTPSRRPTLHLSLPEPASVSFGNGIATSRSSIPIPSVLVTPADERDSIDSISPRHSISSSDGDSIGPHTPPDSGSEDGESEDDSDDRTPTVTSPNPGPHGNGNKNGNGDANGKMSLYSTLHIMSSLSLNTMNMNTMHVPQVPLDTLSPGHRPLRFCSDPLISPLSPISSSLQSNCPRPLSFAADGSPMSPVSPASAPTSPSMMWPSTATWHLAAAVAVSAEDVDEGHGASPSKLNANVDSSIFQRLSTSSSSSVSCSVPASTLTSTRPSSTFTLTSTSTSTRSNSAQAVPAATTLVSITPTLLTPAAKRTSSSSSYPSHRHGLPSLSISSLGAGIAEVVPNTVPGAVLPFPATPRSNPRSWSPISSPGGCSAYARQSLYEKIKSADAEGRRSTLTSPLNSTNSSTQGDRVKRMRGGMTGRKSKQRMKGMKFLGTTLAQSLDMDLCCRGERGSKGDSERGGRSDMEEEDDLDDDDDLSEDEKMGFDVRADASPVLSALVHPAYPRHPRPSLPNRVKRPSRGLHPDRPARPSCDLVLQDIGSDDAPYHSLWLAPPPPMFTFGPVGPSSPNNLLTPSTPTTPSTPGSYDMLPTPTAANPYPGRVWPPF